MAMVKPTIAAAVANPPASGVRRLASAETTRYAASTGTPGKTDMVSNPPAGQN